MSKLRHCQPIYTRSRSRPLYDQTFLVVTVISKTTSRQPGGRQLHTMLPQSRPRNAAKRRTTTSVARIFIYRFNFRGSWDNILPRLMYEGWSNSNPGGTQYPLVGVFSWDLWKSYMLVCMVVAGDPDLDSPRHLRPWTFPHGHITAVIVSLALRHWPSHQYEQFSSL